ncbi:MAG TPA: LuxR C-terminal-related transcriptional regulator [Candidatus Dormibacteraeota bacterium]|nr:LuxR C-terminal-related transcriptional regulator [Candidatus Dormibacteraeota bacterium]
MPGGCHRVPVRSRSIGRRWQECTDECARSGYGLFESRPLLLPLHVDALIRLDRAGEAERVVLCAEGAAGPDRFFLAALEAARFRLTPSAESWARARQAAASAPWPFLEAQAGAWCLEHLGNRAAGRAALRLFSAIGARRRADRTAGLLATDPLAERGALEEASVLRLSQRELQVAALVAEGLSNRDIATRLSLSAATVTTHVKHILTKLDFRSRAQVAAWISEQRMRSWENDLLLSLSRKGIP